MSIHLWRTEQGHYAGDGRNSEHGKSYFMFRVGPGATADDAQPGNAPPQGGIASLAGTWQFSKKGDSKSCQVELSSNPSPFGGFQAKRAIGGFNCSDLGPFHLRTWNLAGGDVVLIDAFNKVVARLRPRGNFLLRGGDFVMQR